MPAAGPEDAPVVRLEGFHAVKHALRFAPGLVSAVVCTDVDRLLALSRDLAPDLLDELRDRAQVGAVEHPTGVLGLARRPAEDRSVLTARTAPLIVLDAPRSPGNAGAVVRVAAAAGACGVAVDGDLDPWGSAVLRGSAGLHYALPVLSLPGPGAVRGTVVVLDAAGDPRLRLPADAVLVAGSERHGVGAAWRARADAVLALPMRPGVSSLNLATAVAAALYRR